MIFGRKKPQDDKPVNSKDYEKMGRMIESMYDAVNPNRKALYRTAFLKGIATGVGGVIGATVVIALVLWLLSLFTEVPLIGGFVESLQNTLEQE